MKPPAMRGTQHEAIPRHRSTWNLARFARPTRFPSSQEPVTSRVTTAQGGDNRRQTSSDGPITLISADPTRCDLAGRTHSLGNGDVQRPIPGHIRLLRCIESDNHRPEGRKQLSTSRYPNGQRDPHRLVSHLILKSTMGSRFEKYR